MSKLQQDIEDLNDRLPNPKSPQTESVDAMERIPAADGTEIRPLAASNEIDYELSPFDIGYVSPNELAKEMTELNLKAKQSHSQVKQPAKIKRRVKLINTYDKPIDDQNPWYFRFLHGAKAGSLIGASAGALFSPAAPLVSTAVGTIFGAIAGGTFTAFIGPVIGGYIKQYFPKLHNFFYPPYVEVDMELTDQEYNYIVNSHVAYNESEFNLEAAIRLAAAQERKAQAMVQKAATGSASEVEQTALNDALKQATANRMALERELTDIEKERKLLLIGARNQLGHSLKLRYLYPQKSTQFSRPSIFLKWDMNTMMGALGGVTIGAAIGTLIGGPIGAAIGGVVGGAIGIAIATAAPHLTQRIQNTEIVVTPVNKQNRSREEITEQLRLGAQKTLQNAANTPTPPQPKLGSWYEESPNDVPFAVRIAVGAAAGATIGSVVPGVGTLVGTAVGALVGAGAGYFSPTLFRFARGAINTVKNLFVSPDDKPQAPENDERDDKNWPESLKEDQYNLNWYVRLMPGVVTGLAVGAAVGTIFPGVGTAIGGVLGGVIGGLTAVGVCSLVGVAVGGALAVASPMLFAAARKVVAGIKTSYSFIKGLILGEQASSDVKKQQATHQESDEVDVPWHIRALAGATTGAAIGGTIGLIVGTVVPGIGNLVGVTAGAAIGTMAGTAAVIAWTPVRDAVVSIFTALKEKIFPTKEVVEDADYYLVDQNTKVCKQVSKEDYLVASAANPKDKNIPWHIKTMAGSMAGSIIGGAIGTVAGSIFPGIGTALGALAGAAIGGAAGAGIYYVGSLIIEKIAASKQAAEEKTIVENYRHTSVSKPAVIVEPASDLKQAAPVLVERKSAEFNAVSPDVRDKKAIVAYLQSRKRQSAVPGQFMGLAAAATSTNIATEQTAATTAAGLFAGLGMSS